MKRRETTTFKIVSDTIFSQEKQRNDDIWNRLYHKIPKERKEMAFGSVSNPKKRRHLASSLTQRL